MVTIFIIRLFLKRCIFYLLHNDLMRLEYVRTSLLPTFLSYLFKPTFDTMECIVKTSTFLFSNFI